MALSGLDIYKLLAKTNCKKCGFPTCLAFAMQLAKKAVTIDRCPDLSEEAKRVLSASAQPPIKLVTIGAGDNSLSIGNETVLFRHEEKFHHPCGIGFIINDSLSEGEAAGKIAAIAKLSFERVGQKLDVNLLALKQSSGAEDFLKLVKTAMEKSGLGLVLMSEDPVSLRKALEITRGRRPLVYKVTPENIETFGRLCAEFKVPAVVSGPDLDTVADLTKKMADSGCDELVIETLPKGGAARVEELTQIRRQALRKSNRALGFPTLTVAANSDTYLETMEAAACIAKYAGIVLINGTSLPEVLSLLTLRQNIYTDPQKPLQIESKVYPVGAVTKESPFLVTTNFSLSYYTVLGEVEASKIPSYILSVDTEGMSVLTAWAAEKFTPEKISGSLEKFGASSIVASKKLIIPGYVAVMSGDLQEQSGWQVVVGPKEAAGLPSFLKNYK